MSAEVIESFLGWIALNIFRIVFWNLNVFPLESLGRKVCIEREMSDFEENDDFMCDDEEDYGLVREFLFSVF